MPKHVSGLGTIFAPGAANAVNSASDAIDSTLTPGSAYFNSGNIGLGSVGTVGNGLLNSAAQLGQMQVGINPTAMDHDVSSLTGLANQQYGLAQAGGPAEAAAREQALSDIANLGSGGAGAGKSITAGSRDLTNQATNVAQSERTQNQDASTKMGSSAAATALQKAVYEAHVSHANHMTALAARGYQNALSQMQAQYDEQLNSAAANARNGQQSAYQSANDTTRKAELSAAMGIASAGTTAGATIDSMMTATPQTYTGDASGKVGGINLGVPTASGGTSSYSASVAMQPGGMGVIKATINPFQTDAIGNTATAPDPKQWSTWLTGSTLAP